VAQPQRYDHAGGECCRERQVRAGHGEHVAEKQLLHRGGRIGRQRQECACSDERGDDHGDRGVTPERPHPGRVRDRRRRDSGTEHRPQHQREASEGSDHQTGEQRVAERLGAVGEAVQHDPASERAGGQPQQRNLDQGPA
jgi:hypothetical protein